MPQKRWIHLILILLLALTLLVLLRQHSAGGEPIDAHKLYVQKCVGCHEADANAFATGTHIVGNAAGRDVAGFLATHRGTKLTPDEIKALTDHFGTMLSTGWLHQEKCAGCHSSAAELARSRLSEQNGKLQGRYSGRDIDSFLSDHGRLTEPQIDVIRAMLRRQLSTKAD